ncbi:MAG: hypothetical protein FWB93_00250 [Oscillospiraceae bacterium]|nr:hypothetical protein [Oscillospiraceae bacterium]
MKKSTKLVALIMAIVMVAALSVVSLSAGYVTYDEVDVIALIETYVYVDEDGLISFDFPTYLLALLGEEVDGFAEWIDYLNEYIEEEVLAITPNLTIYEIDDDTLTIQGGNVNRITFLWWGTRFHMSRQTAANYVSMLRGALGFGVPLAGLAAMAGPFGAIAVGFGAAHGVLLAERITFHNNRQNRGVIVDRMPLGIFSVNPQ